jgi:Predicted amidohydrolase
MRISLAQPNCAKNKEEIINSVNNLIKEASIQKSHIVCLPEHWIFHKEFTRLLKDFCKLASDCNINIITGGNYVEENNAREVRCYVINNEGKVLGYQSKMHLYGAEKQVAMPGKDYNVFQIDGIRIGIAICHDLVFPEVCRILTIKGSEIVFVPSRINKLSYEGWKIYALARALENRIFIACPITLLQPNFPGRSFIVDFDINIEFVIPRISNAADESEGIIVANIELKKIKNFREERLKNRRPETYGKIVEKINV